MHDIGTRKMKMPSFSATPTPNPFGGRFLAEANTRIFQRKGRKGFDAKGAKFFDRIHRIDRISHHGLNG